MIPKVKVALVGLGRAGGFHLRSLSQHPGVVLKYIVDPAISRDNQLLAAHPGVVILPDLEPVLNDAEVDAVVVASPTPFHFDHITSALQAKKHVFSEKPLGQSLKDIKLIYQLARDNHCALFLGFQRRYDHNFQVLKSKLAQLGEVKLYRASSRDHPKPAIEYLKISGNIFHDMLIHDFDMLVYLLGSQPPESIVAIGHAHDPEIANIPDYDHVMVTLKYASGTICSIDTSRFASYGYDQRVEVFGESGMITAQIQSDHTVEVWDQQGAHQAPINYSFPQRYRQSYQLEIEDFIQGIFNKQLHNISEEACVLSHLIAEAAFESCQQNQVVGFNKFVPDLSN